MVYLISEYVFSKDESPLSTEGKIYVDVFEVFIKCINDYKELISTDNVTCGLQIMGVTAWIQPVCHCYFQFYMCDKHLSSLPL